MILHDASRRHFASDNYSGVHPEVLAAVEAANGGHQVSYGDDEYSAELQSRFVEMLGPEVETYPVFNGTGANVLSLQALLPRWGAVVTADTAHINVDEGGAPEKMGGIKILPVATPDGKLTPELVERQAWGWGNEHRAQPLTLSVTQSTELGTLYSLAELHELCDHAHSLGMTVHLDGSRIANAAAALEVSLRELTRGVDVLSFGGTKNGALGAEAVVVLNPAAAPGMKFLRKNSMQLASKMRFVSAQLLALLTDDLWLRNARHSNALATLLRASLEEALGGFAGVRFTQPTQANAVFVSLPEGVADRIRESYRFYDWDAARREVRLMCSFDTTAEDVHAFAAEALRCCKL